MRYILFATIAMATVAASALAQKADKVDMDSLLDHLDCAGHKGRTTICVVNNTSRIIVSLRCGSYDVPITTFTHTLPPYQIAAVIELGDSPRTCRNEGLTAGTKTGKTFKATLDGADVAASTIATFTE